MAAPVQWVSSRLDQGHHALGNLGSQRRDAPGPRVVAPQGGDAFGSKPILPAPPSLAAMSRLDVEDAELHAAGCGKVYAEKVSGARSDRPELAKALKRLETGDVLVVTRLNRLARSTRDLLNLLDDIAKRGAGFKSLSDGRVRAKARGVKFGRPSALTAHQRHEALQRLGNGEAQADVARTFNVSQATISRLQA
jgi:DNA invertase Pin-like site-specific DNA recombinase